MLTQTTLFTDTVPFITNHKEFFNAVREQTLDNTSLVWTAKRAFLNHDVTFTIVPVEQLTAIPAWPKMSDAKEIETILTIKTKLFAKLNGDHVIAVAGTVSELLSGPEISALYNSWRN